MRNLRRYHDHGAAHVLEVPIAGHEGEAYVEDEVQIDDGDDVEEESRGCDIEGDVERKCIGLEGDEREAKEIPHQAKPAIWVHDRYLDAFDAAAVVAQVIHRALFQLASTAPRQELAWGRWRPLRFAGNRQPCVARQVHLHLMVRVRVLFDPSVENDLVDAMPGWRPCILHAGDHEAALAFGLGGLLRHRQTRGRGHRCLLTDARFSEDIGKGPADIRKQVLGPA
mmetsp:Transcript_250/g.568  ORF Transcript_250/g.568 Transcript_250/m.568 type:complete len:225 (+) Transcript_250:761-1435(+)